MGASTPEQVENLIRLKFHEAAGWSSGDVETSAGRPESPNGILVVSELFLPIAKQCELLGIDNRLTIGMLDQHKNISVVPEKFFYWCYGIDDGRAMVGLSPEKAISQLADTGRFPATTALVLAIFREDIHVISGNHRIDVGGSRIEGDLIPTLQIGNGTAREHRPVLSSTRLVSAGKPTYGMASYARAK